jgi:hypothetical protein
MACGRTNHRNYRVIVSHRRMSEDQNGTAHSPGTQILCMLSVFRTSVQKVAVSSFFDFCAFVVTSVRHNRIYNREGRHDN